jgi:hypothetical protein
MAGDAHPLSPNTEHVRWRATPQLTGSLMLVAFEGWSDAGDAASTAVAAIGDQWDAAPFADIDPELFFDFSSTRPRVQLDDDLQREVVWPENGFSFCTVPTDADASVITLLGVEPQLRWRTFTEQILGVARACDVQFVLTLGALLAEVPHSRPVSVFATSYDDEVVRTHDLAPSRYEGPTGITGVLHTACRDVGIPSASLWAAVPTYVPGAPSPKAALALVHRAAEFSRHPVVTTELEIASAAYERQVDELVADDEETRHYVAQLEQRFDAGSSGPFNDQDNLVDEVERFLRELPE